MILRISLVPILLTMIGAAGAEPLVLRSTRIFDGREFVSGTVVVSERGVTSVGADPAHLPAGARVLDLGDRPVTPGLVDLDTRLGLAADPAGPNREVWRSAGDALGDGEDLRDAARDEGISAAVVAPGDRALIGGLLAAIRAGSAGPVVTSDAIAFKVSLGPGLSATRGPTSLGGAAMALRDAFRRDLGSLRDALPFWVACGSDVDVRLALAFGPPHGLVVTGAPERSETAVRLYAAGVRVVLGPLEMDDPAGVLRSAATLRHEGVRIGFSSGDRGAAALRRTAALAVREGLSERDALCALTAGGAAIAGLPETVGRLIGSRDVVVWSASPVDLASHPLLVILDGEVVRDDIKARLPASPTFLPAPADGAREAPPAPRDPPQPRAKAGRTLITASLVIPIAGPPIRNGRLLIENGKIVAVGPDLESPEGVTTLDLGETVVMPGLVDASSAIAGAINEHTDEVTPDWRVLDQVDLESPGFATALAAGVTTAYVGPGTRNIVGGRGAVLRTAGERRVLRPAADLSVSMGRDSMAGNRGDLRRSPPTRFTHRRPATRMAVNRMLRYLLAGLEDGSRLMRDAHAAAFARALRDGARLRVLARVTQDLRTALRIANEFGVEFVLEDAIAAAEVADDLAAAGFPVVLGTPPHPSRQGRAAEGANVRLAVAGALEAAGVTFAFGSRSAGTSVDVRTAAILAYRHGLSRDGALRAVTLEAARICGVADRVGSIAPGRDADLLVLSGDPLDPATRVVLVLIEGAIVLDSRGKGFAR